MGCSHTDETIVNTTCGPVQGSIEDGVFVWKGIPYAKPPVGDLRWKAPERMTPWTAVRPANTYGNICPQKGYGPQSIYEIPSQNMSEDCLYLNVWSPPNTTEKKPVFVWIHGGSLTREGGSSPQYLGKNLAKKDLVYVSFNYRLHAFGFLAHPELSKENEYGVSGNYGIMDQIKALEWIQDNIASFGGDPDNVTIAGESAGGWSVSLLVATQKAKGLFHKAIAQSGTYLWPGPHLKTSYNDYKSGESEGEVFMQKLNARSVEELRNTPADDIVNLFFSKKNTISSEPLVDGYLFDEDVYKTYDQLNHNKVDVMVGANADEWGLWIPDDLPKNPEAYKATLKQKYAERADLFLKAYPISDATSIGKAYADFQSDKSFHLHNRNWAKAMHKGGNKVYMYYFSKIPTERYPEEYGAFHGVEIAYALNNLEHDPGTLGGSQPSQLDSLYADKVSDYWVNFVKTGDPNNTVLPLWPLWDTENQDYLHFDNNIQGGKFLLKERLDALEDFLSADSKRLK